MIIQTEYFSYKQAMKYMGFNSYDSLREVIKLGLPVIEFGKSKRISKSAIDKFMQDHTARKYSKSEVISND
ncbi:DNA-binding protein [Lactobacillus gallinarum]|uniref:DNA-binding protein n=1 Tax=Lactobacillus gallinarum TaxID=52242 RepID=UPI00248DF24D|nr:DNA-binding protein [Lactobacillus gallinarum]